MSVVLSVIIPVFNRQKATEKAIASVLEQNHESFELIVVDDASSVPFFLPQALKNDRRIRVLFHETNKGAGAARNTGIKNASGKYIAFLDSDDVWRAGKISSQMKVMGEIGQKPDVPPLAVVCGFTLKSAVTSKQRSLIPVASNQLSDFVSGCWFCPGSALLIESRAFEMVGLYDETLRRLEDFDWFIRFAQTNGELHVAMKDFVHIEAGTKPHPKFIEEAARSLMSKYIKTADEGRRLSRVNQKLLKSYLALELASAYYANKNKLYSFANLAKSFFLKPRAKLHIENWWT